MPGPEPKHKLTKQQNNKPTNVKSKKDIDMYVSIYIYQVSLLHKQHQKPKAINKRMHVYADTWMPQSETTTAHT